MHEVFALCWCLFSPACENNGKSTEDDRNNTCCSNKGIVCAHSEKT